MAGEIYRLSHENNYIRGKNERLNKNDYGQTAINGVM